MGILRIILTILFVLVCIALTVLVLAQEGKSAGLGAIAGGNSFWEQNKNRSAEGKIVLITKILAAAFIVIALLLNLSFIQRNVDEALPDTESALFFEESMDFVSAKEKVSEYLERYPQDKDALREYYFLQTR